MKNGDDGANQQIDDGAHSPFRLPVFNAALHAEHCMVGASEMIVEPALRSYKTWANIPSSSQKPTNKEESTKASALRTSRPQASFPILCTRRA